MALDQPARTAYEQGHQARLDGEPLHLPPDHLTPANVYLWKAGWWAADALVAPRRPSTPDRRRTHVSNSDRRKIRQRYNPADRD